MISPLKLIPQTPTKLLLVGAEERLTELNRHLTYEDRKFDYQIQKLKHSPWFLRLSPEDQKEKLDSLKAQKHKSLLFQEKDGTYWTYTGMAHKLVNLMANVTLEPPIFTYPERKLVPWAEPLPFNLHPYQEEAVYSCIQNNHCGIELPTSSGKSSSLLTVTKYYGLKTVIAGPSLSIVNQLYKLFSKHLGKKYVGRFDGKKKESKKLFIIATGDSLANVKEGTEHWDNLRQTQVVGLDEAHTWAANTMQEVALNVLGLAPYRFFVSGTQLREDGLETLLKAITGPVTYVKTLKEIVEGGYIAKPKYTMIKTRSDSTFNSKDPNEITRQHFYYNPRLNRQAAEIANGFADKGKKVLILIDEIEQFSCLLPYLKHQVAFAHGTLTKENSKNVPEMYKESDPDELVTNFNNLEIPILIGTSCIATGTDLLANECTIYLVGGRSKIAVLQGAVGRSTRKYPRINKTSCEIVDFSVDNIPTLKRHAMVRKKIYEDTGFPVRVVDL